MKLQNHKIAIISTFPPTQCGIATYSNDLCQSLRSLNQPLEIVSIVIQTDEQQITQNVLEIRSNKIDDYHKICDYINSSDIDLVDIQHEFKLYGDPYGEHVIILLKNIKKPIFTTLHTVFAKLNASRENVFTEIITRSDRLFVFSAEAKDFIVEKYGKSFSQIDVIPHGVPKIIFKKPEDIPERISSPVVFVSSGHMRDTKGYDTAIKSLQQLKKEGFDFHYLIIGSNHPKNDTSQPYRDYLVNLNNEFELSKHVTFINEYLDNARLIQYIQSADVCLLPYTGKEQSSSGVLSLMVACGKPVVSTPFQFAKCYINSSMGIVADSFTQDDFLKAIRKLLVIKDSWSEMSFYNHNVGKEWRWDKVAQKYYSGYKPFLNK